MKTIHAASFSVPVGASLLRAVCRFLAMSFVLTACGIVRNSVPPATPAQIGSQGVPSQPGPSDQSADPTTAVVKADDTTFVKIDGTVWTIRNGVKCLERSASTRWRSLDELAGTLEVKFAGAGAKGAAQHMKDVQATAQALDQTADAQVIDTLLARLCEQVQNGVAKKDEADKAMAELMSSASKSLAGGHKEDLQKALAQFIVIDDEMLVLAKGAVELQGATSMKAKAAKEGQLEQASKAVADDISSLRESLAPAESAPGATPAPRAGTP